jgi:transcriptional regulator with XRE-family HTH domain
MGTPGIPNYYGRQLLRKVRRLRELSGLTQEEAGRALHLTLQKLSRIENGQLPGYHEMRAMLKLYGLPQAQWGPFVELWELARKRGWWRKYGIKDSTYICMEQEAASMCEFQLGRLPALLQTERYVRMALDQAMPRDGELLENNVAVNVRRQERLCAEKPLVLHSLVHEPVLHQGVGRGELIHLYQRAQLGNVTFQIVPQSAGPHAGLDGSMILFEFDDPFEPQIVFTETVLGVNYSQDEEKTSAVRVILDRLADLALSPEDSLTTLKRLIG